jgi:hypothetical protein
MVPSDYFATDRNGLFTQPGSFSSPSFVPGGYRCSPETGRHGEVAMAPAFGPRGDMTASLRHVCLTISRGTPARGRP